MDRVDPDTRSRMMSFIRGSGAAPERAARIVARHSGLPHRINARDLPGSPDIVFPTEKVALFVHGCFWHRHAGCQAGSSSPKSNRQFWERKFLKNVARDAEIKRRLRAMGWKVEVIWECEL